MEQACYTMLCASSPTREAPDGVQSRALPRFSLWRR